MKKREREHTIHDQIRRRLPNDGLPLIRRQGIFAILLRLPAIDRGRTGPDVDVVLAGLEIGCCNTQSPREMRFCERKKKAIYFRRRGGGGKRGEKGGKERGEEEKRGHTALGAGILETEVFFQIGEIDDFALGELAGGAGEGERIAVGAGS